MAAQNSRSVSSSILGPSWGPLGAHPGHQGKCGPVFGAVLEPSWGRLGAAGRHLGPAWGLLGPNLGHLVAILGRLGAIVEPLGAFLGHLRPAWVIFAYMYKNIQKNIVKHHFGGKNRTI